MLSTPDVASILETNTNTLKRFSEIHAGNAVDAQL